MDTSHPLPPYTWEQKRRSGIYRIVHLETGHEYIGQAKIFRLRWTKHRVALRKGDHVNEKLKRAWRKYGEDAFQFEILEFCPLELLTEREQWYLDTRQPYFNASMTAGSTLGMKHGEGMKAKVSAISKARWADPAYREKVQSGVSAAMKELRASGWRPTPSSASSGRSAEHLRKQWEDPAYREKMRQISRDRWADPQKRERIMAAKNSPEARAKIQRRVIERFADPREQERASIRSKANWENPGYREKVTEAIRAAKDIEQFGRVLSPEERAAVNEVRAAKKRAYQRERYAQKIASRPPKEKAPRKGTSWTEERRQNYQKRPLTAAQQVALAKGRVKRTPSDGEHHTAQPRVKREPIIKPPSLSEDPQYISFQDALQLLGTYKMKLFRLIHKFGWATRRDVADRRITYLDRAVVEAYADAQRSSIGMIQTTLFQEEQP